VFFLHITSGPDSTNNALALAFGVLIALLIVAGSLVITANLNENMVAHTELMNLRMQHRAAVSLLSDSSVARPPWSARTACWVA
jgi:hypothetical protein